MIEYERFGVMLDCSRNGVMKPAAVKKMIDYISAMGYNCLELYTEDTFKIDSERYFGYLRGGYSGEEIREIDGYAKSKGIELIPCFQVLGHFDAVVKLPAYKEIVDVDNILLVDEPKTYALIEKIFQFMAENFTSRTANIGMDEAHMLGLGRFLDRFGYQKRFDILLRHLNKVSEIARKYGFTVGMWSDMFFRLLNSGDYYGENVDLGREIVEKIPDNVSLLYWDYYHTEYEIYDKMLEAHKRTGKDVWYAGGAWSWLGFAPFNQRSLDRCKPAMQNVIKHNVKNVLITIWGDDGKECSYFSLLPTLYAVRQFGNNNFDMEQIKAGFEELFGFNFDEFMYLDNVNCTKSNFEEASFENPCKALLYNDCFLGLADKDLENEGELPFAYWSDKLEKAGRKMGELSYLFTTLSSLARVLEVKYDLGLRTRKAYKAKDKTLLLQILERYEESLKRLRIFYDNFKDLWFKENKPYGFEVQDIRLGGLMQRISHCKQRLAEYVAGKITEIPELEEEIYEYGNNRLYHCVWANTVTTSKL